MPIDIKQPATMPATNPGHRRNIININIIIEMVSIIANGNNGLSSIRRWYGLFRWLLFVVVKMAVATSDVSANTVHHRKEIKKIIDWCKIVLSESSHKQIILSKHILYDLVRLPVPLSADGGVPATIEMFWWDWWFDDVVSPRFSIQVRVTDGNSSHVR